MIIAIIVIGGTISYLPHWFDTTGTIFFLLGIIYYPASFSFDAEALNLRNIRKTAVVFENGGDEKVQLEIWNFQLFLKNLRWKLCN